MAIPISDSPIEEQYEFLVQEDEYRASDPITDWTDDDSDLRHDGDVVTDWDET